MNDFLLNDAKKYFAAMLAVTYVLEDIDAQKTVAYYSLLNDKIVFEPDGRKIWNQINRSIPNQKRRRTYPALKIGRLAVATDYSGQSIGRMILMQLKMVYSRMSRSGCRFLTVDAYTEAIPFYIKCGFNFLTDKDAGERTRAMYFDLKYFQK